MNAENPTIESPSCVVEDAYTFFVVPFYFDNEFFPNKDLWEDETSVLVDKGYNGESLYPYIMNFLYENEDSESKTSLKIYRLSKTTQSYNLLWKTFGSSVHVLDINKGRQKRTIKFKFIIEDTNRYQNRRKNYGILTPHIIVSPKGCGDIGFLVFGIELDEEIKTIEELKLLNYYLHKTQGELTKCICPAFDLSEEMTVERVQKAREFIGWHYDVAPEDGKSPEWNPESGFSWNMKTLVDAWLGESVTRFSSIRANVFTYCHIKDLENRIDFNSISSDLIRFSRCIIDKYHINIDDKVIRESCYQPYDNIFMSSCVEGTAIITVGKKDNENAIRNMIGNIRFKYVWIYILAMYQRYAMLNVTRKLAKFEDEYSTNIEEDNSLSPEEKEKALKNKANALKSLIDTIKQVKVRCFYTDVSSYTHNNGFYQLCRHNLHISDISNEIDKKTEVLNYSVNQGILRMKDTIEQQRQEQKALLEAIEKERNDEIKRMQDERKIFEEQRRTDRQKELDQEKKAQDRLNIFLAVLAGIQAVQVLFAFVCEENVVAKACILVGGILSSLLILWIIRKKDNNKKD
jgi:hypothetical protein